jgi:hypothetical protein
MIDRTNPEDRPDPRAGALPDGEMDPPALPEPPQPEGLVRMPGRTGAARNRLAARGRAAIDADPDAGETPAPQGDTVAAQVNSGTPDEDITPYIDPNYDIQRDAQVALARYREQMEQGGSDRLAGRGVDTTDPRLPAPGLPEPASGVDGDPKLPAPAIPEPVELEAEGPPAPKGEPTPQVTQPGKPQEGAPNEAFAKAQDRGPTAEKGDIARVKTALPEEERAPEPVNPDAGDSVHAATRNYEQQQKGPNVSPRHAGEAISAGFTFLQGIFGLKQGAIPGTGANRRGIEGYAKNVGAASPEEVAAGLQRVDPKGVMPEDARMMALMNEGYKFYMERGEPDKAMKYAAGLLMHTKAAVQKAGYFAQAALENGDVEGAAKAVAKGHSKLIDGQSMKIEGVQGNAVAYAMVDDQGNLTHRGKATADQVMQIALGMQNGSAWLDQIQQFVTKSRSAKAGMITPYQQKSLELQERRLKLEEERLGAKEAGTGKSKALPGKPSAAERKDALAAQQAAAEDEGVDKAFDPARQQAEAANPEDHRARGFALQKVDEKADEAVGAQRAERAFNKDVPKTEIPQRSDMNNEELDGTITAALGLKKALKPEAMSALRGAVVDIAAANRMGDADAAQIVKQAMAGQVKVDRSGLVLVDGRQVKISRRGITALAQLRAAAKGPSGYSQANPGAGNITSPGKAPGAAPTKTAKKSTASDYKPSEEDEALRYSGVAQ